MDRTPGCGPGGWRFDSSRAYKGDEAALDRRQGTKPYGVKSLTFEKAYG